MINFVKVGIIHLRNVYKIKRKHPTKCILFMSLLPATFAIKTDMMTLEEIKSIESYCSENSVTIKQRLHDLNIPESNFYYARRMLSRQSTSEGTFIQLGGSSGVSFPDPISPSSGQRRNKNIPVESYMTLELRTESGTAMRIQGNFTSEHLGVIMSSLR